MAEDTPIRMAKSVSLSRCEHGSVFATASLDIETAVEFNAQLVAREFGVSQSTVWRLKHRVVRAEP